MSVHIIEGTPRGSDQKMVAYYDDTSMWAFGPIFAEVGEAEAFLAYLLPRDPRAMDDGEIEKELAAFRHLRSLE